MNRDELLTKLAMELADWPNDLKQCESVKLPGLAYWNCGRVTGDVVVWPDRKMKGAGLVIGASDWLQRRAELINCPPDSKAPQWAKWKAQDADGLWYWHGGCPQEGDILFNHECRGISCKLASQGKTPAGHDWRTTLTKINREDDTMTPQEERAWVEKDQQLNGKKSKGWRGPEDGLPPIGQECEALCLGSWEPVKIIGHDGDVAVFRNPFNHNDVDYGFGAADYFRSIRTDRDHWIEQAQKTVDGAKLTDSDSLYGAIWDAGLGKLPN